MKNEAFVGNNDLYLSVEPFCKLNNRLIVGFSTRNNGCSIKPYNSLNLGLHVQDNVQDVITNRNKLATKLGIPLSNWVLADQVHGNQIKKVHVENCGAGTLNLNNVISNTDGLYTFAENVLLCSLYADCVPLYFYAPNYRIIGLAHAGWKGTVAQIGPNMIRLWTEKEHIPLKEIYVAIGPSISQGYYEVDDFVISKVKNVLNSNSPFPYEEISPNKYLLNLKELNKQLLIRAGVKEEQIFVSNYCTYNESELFFSYRREQKTGRMMSFIGRI